jgi:hypothetical protein
MQLSGQLNATATLPSPCKHEAERVAEPVWTLRDKENIFPLPELEPRTVQPVG